jgi:hypothetical protein
VRGEGGFGGALETFEFGLLVGGETGRGGGVLEEGGCEAVGSRDGFVGERAEGAEGTEEVAGHFSAVVCCLL